MSYKVIRFYFESRSPRTILKGLTLEEAKAYCSSNEASSKTCTNPSKKAITRRCGAWFEGFAEE